MTPTARTAPASASPAPAGDPLAPSDDLLSRCTRVGGLARPRAEEIDREGVLPQEVIAALDEERIFSLTLPRALGGRGCTPGEVVGAVMALTYADASLGWTALIGQSSGFLSWMDPGAAAEITGETPHPRVAGSMAPAGRGVPEPGPDGTPGFRLSGRWPYNSGCRHAQWLVVAFIPVGAPGGAPAPAGENAVGPGAPSGPVGGPPGAPAGGRPGGPGGGPAGGPPPSRWGLVRAEDVRTVPTWDVMGLRGTASDDIVIEDVWIPARRTFDPVRGQARQDGAIFRHTLFTFLMTVMAGFPLGLTRRVLDDFTELAAARGRLGSRGTLLDDPLVQARLLQAHSEARAARLLVAEAVAALDAGAGEDPVPARAALAAAVQNAQRVCLETAEWAFHTAGGSAVHTSHPLQRAWRDAVTASSHIAFSTSSAGRTARALLRPESLTDMEALLV
ncbi:acyl-CoA dehydrogenase family protein [Streptomyces sp. 8N706]|uniref:acyl-CoA dehydrogenase family protein n=1 Tax=Streptomyces sp. 8N706 TaxID=3457416 RepID=UPI003FD18D16